MEDYQIISAKTLHKICRTCLIEGNLLYIFEENYEGRTLSQLLEYCTMSKVESDDALPKNICIVCRDELLHAYDFIRKCKDSHTSLSMLLNYTVDDSDSLIPVIETEINTECDDDNVCYSNSSEDILSSKVENVSAVNVSNSAEGDTSGVDNFGASETRVVQDERADLALTRSVVDLLNFQADKSGAPCKVVRGESEVKKVSNVYATDRVTCEICNKRFARPYLLKEHIRSHTKEKPFFCAVCSKRFSNSSNLARHKRIHTGEKPYVCDICGKGCIQSSTLIEHKKIHKEAHQYSCNHCSKNFKTQLNYKMHLLKSHPDKEDQKVFMKSKSYDCLKCAKKLSSQTALNSHMLNHGEKLFLCKDCGRGFVTKGALLTHSRSHTGEKPFLCQYCDKSFSLKASLKQHILIHMGVKPYICSLCAKAFVQQHQLTYHMRTHSGERPYVCPICGKAFALNGNLTVHIRTHTGETPYVCSVCDKGFHNSSSLKKHSKKHKLPKVKLESETAKEDM